MKKFYHYFFVLSFLLLIACGQKGPLYLKPEVIDMKDDVPYSKEGYPVPSQKIK